MPISELDLQQQKSSHLLVALIIAFVAVATASLGLVSIQISLALAVVLLIVSGIISLKDAYASIEWPILVLIGGMIPVGMSLESTGLATRIAELIISLGSQSAPIISLILLLLTTIVLTNLINNAAVAVLMAPVGVGLANGLGVSVDPFLIAVAIGSSLAFLTPIGHQSNVLVMGPGNYRFGDYWRMGLPLTLLLFAIGVPLIAVCWPF
jgi:di/tricarboxylate transporter